MPAATPMRVRREIVQRRVAGESYAAIARDLEMPYGTVRGIDRHYRRAGQLEPSYDRCRQTDVRKEKTVYEQAVALKQAHPSWGGGLVWVELADCFDEEDLPSVRTLQRWFHRASLVPPPPDKPPAQPVARGVAPHEVWALDAKEQIQLQDGSWVSWVTISDEGSGAVLAVTLFPPQVLDAG